MFKINLQLFAHKKGVGSSRNGRPKDLVLKGETASSCWRATYWFGRGEQKYTPASMYKGAAMIHCSLLLMEWYASRTRAGTKNR